jgi:hypothetical protein
LAVLKKNIGCIALFLGDYLAPNLRDFDRVIVVHEQSPLV